MSYSSALTGSHTVWFYIWGIGSPLRSRDLTVSVYKLSCAFSFAVTSYPYPVPGNQGDAYLLPVTIDEILSLEFHISRIAQYTVLGLASPHFFDSSVLLNISPVRFFHCWVVFPYMPQFTHTYVCGILSRSSQLFIWQFMSYVLSQICK